MFFARETWSKWAKIRQNGQKYLFLKKRPLFIKGDLMIQKKPKKAILSIRDTRLNNVN